MRQFRSIIYVADAESQRKEALERAIILAQNNQARLTVLYVWAEIPQEVYGAGRRLRESLERLSFDHFQRQAAPLGGDSELEFRVTFGRPFIEVIREVLRGGHDLVIKDAGSENIIRQRLFGSTDMHLLRKCPCPVWLLKPGDPLPHRRIMAAVDFDPDAAGEQEQGLNYLIGELAVSLAISEFTELHIVHAWEALAENVMRIWGDSESSEAPNYVETERRRRKEALDRLVGGLGERLGAEALAYAAPRLHLPRGAAYQVIPQLAAELEVDLVIMGTVGRTGIPGLLMGNTAETILNHIDCSVLAVKPPGFVSPVQP